MTTSVENRFGQLLRRHRLAAGLSQAELAERAGLSTDGVGALESGRRASPRLHTVRALTDALALAETDRIVLIDAAKAGTAAAVPDASAGWTRLPGPPRSPTRLIGREREVAEIAFALRTGLTRLLTLTGPGGVGKTRLAIAATEVMAETFPDGVAWVELAHIAAPPDIAASRVAAAIASALGIRETTREPLAAPLAAAIGAREMVLILDNVEHLLAAAPLVAELLAACSGLSVLATSRERLGLRGEREFAVLPLAAPSASGSSRGPADGISNVAAVRLFVERATEVRGDFALTEANAAAVAELCRRLDGLPLAIELAVGWLKVLPPQALAAQLAPRLPLLTGGAADLPNRQRTMRDTIAWSHDLLSPEERKLFRRLGVFAGGFTLDAAEWVSDSGFQVSGTEPGTHPPTPDTRDPTPETLALVAALVDKNLARPLTPATASGTFPRFGMLETIREFALERLAESGEEEATRAAHAAHMVALVDTLIPTPGGERPGWLERLAPEIPNLRVALAHAVDRGDAAVALRLAEAWQLLCWFSRADSGEALRWLEAALTLDGGAEARVHALIAASGLAALRGDHPRAATLAEEGLTVSNARNYPFGVAYALFYLGVTEEWSGNLDRAAARYEEAIARWADLSEPYWLALAQTNLGGVALWRGDTPSASALAAEGLAGSRAVDDPWGAALALGVLAAVACAEGYLPRAAKLHRECLDLWSSMGDRRGVAGALAGLADISVAAGNYSRAARLLGAAAALGEAIDATHLVHHEQYERALAKTRAGLDESTFSQALAEGRALSRDEIDALVTELAPAT